MTRWSFRLNLPGRGRYEPPTPHIPTQRAGDQPADEPATTPQPPNRSKRFPEPRPGEQS